MLMTKSATDDKVIISIHLRLSHCHHVEFCFTDEESETSDTSEEPKPQGGSFLNLLPPELEVSEKQSSHESE